MDLIRVISPKMVSFHHKTPYKILLRHTSGINMWNHELTNEIKHNIEKFWQHKLHRGNFNESSSKDKFYVLSMFPYPSGNLHMGHVRVYTISDTVAQFQRMNNKNVLHPMGWDAFGLPAENAAINNKISPQDWTKFNISQMKSQLKNLGCCFDWDREINTSDPEYYKWTQTIFLKLFKEGLVYQKKASVNWDPIDCTVLADEQVDENGCSWRSGAKVEKKIFKQWFVRTTKYAKDLLEGLNSSSLYDWRDIIKLQKHWIGECNGVVFDFNIVDCDDFITLWTSNPEYIHHVKFVTVSHEHYILNLGNKINGNDRTFKLDITLVNPFTQEKIPVFVTDEIEYSQGTDSFIGIPATCEKARIFAEKNNIHFDEIQILQDSNDIDLKRNSVCDEAKSRNIGGYWSSAKLKDWLVSRQRYWGTPIPIIHCHKCGAQPVPEQELPVKLPLISSKVERGGLHLAECEDWVNTPCPRCKAEAKRETDTLDTFVDSSWYYLRYIDPHNRKEIFNKEKARKTTPVDLYIGGKEHGVLHLYYARFMSYFLHDIGLIPEKEPFTRLLVQGMVMGRSFRLKGSGKYLPPQEVEIIDSKKNKAIEKKTGAPVVMAWEKMSKSKLNGVEPSDMFEVYGVDTTRLLILADVSPTSHRNWNSNTFPGIINWQNRLWLTVKEFLKYRKSLPAVINKDKEKECEDYMFDSRNFYIKGTTFNYYISQQLSVAVSKQQGLTNSLRKMPPYVFARSLQFERALAAQIILLSPMAPHFASELWSGFLQAPNRLNHSSEIRWNKSVLEQDWPEIDSDYNLELLCQVNGYDKCEIKLKRSLLDNLTFEKAVDLAKGESSMEYVFSEKTILDKSFILHKGIKGILNITIDKPVVTEITD
ncbi:probable leucine--tRNA ligase, mitochondrial [Coccinella septempunctata]|uniref:probable leucine--tRNA ligase, mitochondrial n=1 Tax=Coccinella septempunctata TaxID=41139 RepID=UPI001D087A24|nr:probable leucine--tRNA ligase, mitochondrial [Coccinella septempunctata]